VAQARDGARVRPPGEAVPRSRGQRVSLRAATLPLILSSACRFEGLQRQNTTTGCRRLLLKSPKRAQTPHLCAACAASGDKTRQLSSDRNRPTWCPRRTGGFHKGMRRPRSATCGCSCALRCGRVRIVCWPFQLGRRYAWAVVEDLPGVPIQSIFINHVCPRDQHSSLRRPSLRGGAHDNEPLASLVEKRCIFAVLRPTSPAHLASRTVQFRTKLLAQVFLVSDWAHKNCCYARPFQARSTAARGGSPLGWFRYG
jgi:hypothetical protein